jgi:hypothetical protein
MTAVAACKPLMRLSSVQHEPPKPHAMPAQD